MADLGRIMALDIGEVRIGVAVSDPMQIIASPHSVVKEPSRAAAIAALKRLVGQLEPVLIVAGIPLDAHGGEGPQARKTRTFIELLRAELSVEIVTQDERFSTVEATRNLIAADMRREKRRGVVDKVAATHILQGYLDRTAAMRRTTE